MTGLIALRPSLLAPQLRAACLAAVAAAALATAAGCSGQAPDDKAPAAAKTGKPSPAEQPAGAKADSAKPGGAKPESGATPKAALTVTVTQAERSTLATGIVANGSIAPWQEAIVGAEANGLRLSNVLVSVGDVVKKGQLLASFAPEMIQAELAQSKATAAETQAMLAEASANAQRARELQSSGALSAQQINQFLTAERTAQARLQALEAAIQVQQLRLAHTRVLAPDSGVISSRSATVGAVVPAGMELFKLIRQGRLEWRAEVPASDLVQIKPGMTVRVFTGNAAASAVAATAGGAGAGAVAVAVGGSSASNGAGSAAANTSLSGTVRMVAPTVDAATRNGVVYVSLPEPGPAKGGMFARGEFDTGSSSALTLPQSAVLLRDGFSYVFKLTPNNKVVQSKVAVGRRVGERIEITSGLEPATPVVASGGAFLADGDTVKVVQAPAAK